MTKKQICESNETFAYYSGFGGIEFKDIEYGIDDYFYCVAGAWYGPKTYHKLKVYTSDTGYRYIKFHGYTIYLNEIIRIH